MSKGQMKKTMRKAQAERAHEKQEQWAKARLDIVKDEALMRQLRPMFLISYVRVAEYTGERSREDSYRRIREQYGEEMLKKVREEVDRLGKFTDTDAALAVLASVSRNK